MTRERCVTGIEGLDRILGGGLPCSSVNLVLGECGTGKTSLALEFLVRGAERGEKGLLVNTVEPFDKMVSNIPRFDFVEGDHFEEGSIVSLQLPDILESAGMMERTQPEKGIRELCDQVEEKIAERGVKRFVIDSLTPLHFEIGDERLVHHLLRKLSQILYENDCTGLLVSDSGPLSEIGRIIADGVLLMGNHDRNGDLLRTLQVIKMKGTEHSRSKYVIDLTTEGLLVTPLLKGGVG
ncbi:MAG: RAD55 family ATPase [Methanomassiliicoccales archaeon]